MAGHFCQVSQLLHARPSVYHVAGVATPSLKADHVSSSLTVVTDDCHADPIVTAHVTQYGEGVQAFFAVGVDGIISGGWGRIRPFYFATGFGYYHKKKKKHRSQYYIIIVAAIIIIIFITTTTTIIVVVLAVAVAAAPAAARVPVVAVVVVIVVVVIEILVVVTVVLVVVIVVVV